MDFPKSVPGVGLVGDRFVDEDPAIGRQGSLIPSSWGNAVTLELLNVIQAAGLDPSEAQTDQLLEAIRALVPERSAFARITGTQALPASAFGIYALADGGAAATVTLPSTADLVDDTELLLFANHANTAAVQVKAGVGQTVQGPAALMGASTLAFMLPAGGNWVRLRSEKEQGRWVVVAAYEAELASVRSQLGIAGQAKTLRCAATGKNGLVSVTADQLFVESAGGQTLKLRAVNLSIDTATVGANGLDAGMLAASTWYSLWVIAGESGVAGLASLSATAPVLPAGYTQKCRVGWARTDASANKYPLGFTQKGAVVRYLVDALSNVPISRSMASGVVGSPVTPTWVAVGISNFVPPTASEISVVVYCNVALGSAVAAPNNSYGSLNNTANPPPIISAPSRESGLSSNISDFLIESQNIYFASNGAAANLLCVGWVDSI